MSPSPHHEPSEDSVAVAQERADAAVDPTDDIQPDQVSRRSFLAGAMATPVGLWLDSKLRSGDSLFTRGSGPTGACDLPHEILVRCWRGFDKDRSGQLITVPHGKNFMGGYSHASPWPYTQDVPMFWYGPGFIKQNQVRYDPVDCADVAPTIAKLIGFDYQAPDGKLMPRLFTQFPPKKPKLVVVLVWDAGGRYVLDDLHPTAWPNLRALKAKGTWFENATVGSNPSNTAPIHATIGAGSYPRVHGVVDNLIRTPTGGIMTAWGAGPSFLRGPFMPEEYLKQVGTGARVGVVGTVAWHLGMVGRGSLNGGPQPISVLKVVTSPSERVTPKWGLGPQVADYYHFPTYVNDRTACPPITQFFDYADRIDGSNDGKWRGHDIQGMLGGFHTPARIPYQARVVEQVIKREEFGNHSSPDLLFLNFKLIDEVGHLFSASSIEMRDSVVAQDRHLASFIHFMDVTMGLKNQWVLLLTADHGHTAAANVSHGFIISGDGVVNSVEKRFDHAANGRDIIKDVRPMWLTLNQDEVTRNGVTYSQLSQFVANLTKAQAGRPGAHYPPAVADDLVYDAVFAGSIFPSLPCLPEAH